MPIRASHALVPFHMLPGESYHSSVQHQTELLEFARAAILKNGGLPGGDLGDGSLPAVPQVMASQATPHLQRQSDGTFDIFKCITQQTLDWAPGGITNPAITKAEILACTKAFERTVREGGRACAASGSDSDDSDGSLGSDFYPAATPPGATKTDDTRGITRPRTNSTSTQRSVKQRQGCGRGGRGRGGGSRRGRGGGGCGRGATGGAI